MGEVHCMAEARERRASQDRLADELVEGVEGELRILLYSDEGRRYWRLDPDARDVALAILGEPPDEDPDWAVLAQEVRSRMLARAGVFEVTEENLLVSGTN